jgi:hypothetical protein
LRKDIFQIGSANRLFAGLARSLTETHERRPAETLAQTIDAAKKYVVSSTPDRVDWNAELVRGNLSKAVQQLEQRAAKGLFVGGMTLPLAFGGAAIDR